MISTPGRTFLRILTLLTIVSVTFAARGPVTDLRIVNADIAPDGFTRS